MMVGGNKDSNDWAAILDNRAKLGKEWCDSLNDHKRLAEGDRYIRIRGRDFRAVSLNPGNPCGRLLYRCGAKIKGHRDIRKAIESADQSAPIGYAPGNNKPEQKIQAFLIREALINKKDLRFDHLFEGFGTNFKELIFVTDEPRLDNGKLRPDVIAVGSIDGQNYFPVPYRVEVRPSVDQAD